MNDLGYMINVDFNPDGTVAVSILKKIDNDRWISIGMGGGNNLDDAIEEARVRANV